MLTSRNRNILISKCILGVNCRYNCGSKVNRLLIRDILEKNFHIVPVCPEELGGLPTPRFPSFFVDDFNLENSKGENVTRYFLTGASLTLKIAELIKPTYIFFMDKSPSCGVNLVYKKGELISGEGVTTRLLRDNGFDVFSIELFTQIVK